MEIPIILGILLIISLLLAAVSMRDVGYGREIARSIRKHKIKGTIVFFKDKIKHY